MLNSVGESAEPCATPYFRGCRLEEASPSIAAWYLPVRKEPVHRSIMPPTPTPTPDGRGGAILAMVFPPQAPCKPQSLMPVGKERHRSLPPPPPRVCSPHCSRERPCPRMAYSTPYISKPSPFCCGGRSNGLPYALPAAMLVKSGKWGSWCGDGGRRMAAAPSYVNKGGMELVYFCGAGFTSFLPRGH